MSTNVWPTSSASKRSRGQAHRRNPSTFIEEPESKKTRVERQNKTEEAKGETQERVALQQSNQALVPQSTVQVPRLVQSEFALLPTQPAPALEFYAGAIRDRSVLRSPVQNHINIEDALFMLHDDPLLNEHLGRLYPSLSKKTCTVIRIRLASFLLQEGFTAIGSLAQSERKLRALIVATKISNLRLVGDVNEKRRIFASTSDYWRAVTGEPNNSLWLSRFSDLSFDRYRDLLPNGVLKSSTASALRLLQTLHESNWYIQDTEVDDIETQVGLMHIVLVDTHISLSQGASSAQLLGADMRTRLVEVLHLLSSSALSTYWK